MTVKRKDFQKIASLIHEFLLKLPDDAECSELRDAFNFALLQLQRYFRNLRTRTQHDVDPNGSASGLKLNQSLHNTSPMTPISNAADKFAWKWVELDTSTKQVLGTMPTPQAGRKSTVRLPVILRSTRQGNHGFISQLLEQDADSVSEVDDLGRNAVTYAVHFSHLDTLQILLEHGADANQQAHDGSTPVHRACYDGNDEALQLLIQYGADINVADVHGRMPLHWACVAHSTNCLQLLLENSVDLMVRDEDGMSPLMWCCRSDNLRHFELLRQLVCERCGDDNVEEQDETGKTWLHWCVRRSEPLQCLRTLLTTELVSFCGGRNVTVMHMAAEVGSLPAAKLIVELGGIDCLDQRDDNNRTPLIIATIGGHGELVNYLLSEGADLTCTDNSGATAWDYARSRQLHYCMLIIASYLRQRNKESSLNNTAENQINSNYYNTSLNEGDAPVSTIPHPPATLQLQDSLRSPRLLRANPNARRTMTKPPESASIAPNDDGASATLIAKTEMPLVKTDVSSAKDNEAGSSRGRLSNNRPPASVSKVAETNVRTSGKPAVDAGSKTVTVGNTVKQPTSEGITANYNTNNNSNNSSRPTAQQQTAARTTASNNEKQMTAPRYVGSVSDDDDVDSCEVDVQNTSHPIVSDHEYSDETFSASPRPPQPTTTTAHHTKQHSSDLPLQKQRHSKPSNTARHRAEHQRRRDNVDQDSNSDETSADETHPPPNNNKRTFLKSQRPRPSAAEQTDQQPSVPSRNNRHPQYDDELDADSIEDDNDENVPDAAESHVARTISRAEYRGTKQQTTPVSHSLSRQPPAAIPKQLVPLTPASTAKKRQKSPPANSFSKPKSPLLSPKDRSPSSSQVDNRSETPLLHRTGMGGVAHAASSAAGMQQNHFMKQPQQLRVGTRVSRAPGPSQLQPQFNRDYSEDSDSDAGVPAHNMVPAGHKMAASGLGLAVPAPLAPAAVTHLATRSASRQGHKSTLPVANGYTDIPPGNRQLMSPVFPSAQQRTSRDGSATRNKQPVNGIVSQYHRFSHN